MFLIFLLLFGSSQKEGERFPDKVVESKKFRSFKSPKAQNQRSYPKKTTNFSMCDGLGQSSMRCSTLRRKWANQGNQQVGGLEIRIIKVRDALRNIPDSSVGSLFFWFGLVTGAFLTEPLCLGTFPLSNPRFGYATT
jgi:hypothetical protein